MNLWAKRSVRQLAVLAVALFFFSCADETSLLGFKNPKPKFSVSYIEFPLSSSALLIDSVVTDNKGQSGINLIGQYDDSSLGAVRTESFLQMLPTSVSKLDAASIYDSVVFQAKLNFYAYGFSGDENFGFKIHEITGDSLNRMATSRYYYNSTLSYLAEPSGEAFISLNGDSLRHYATLAANKQDTILLKTKLDDELGMRLFDLALNDPSSRFSDAKKFIHDIKGLAVIPSAGNGILGFSSLHPLTRVTLHYHTMNADGTANKLEKTFLFSLTDFDPNFTNITTTRTGELAGHSTYQSFQTSSGMRVVQSGSPAITKIDLKNFYSFADSIDNLIINSAEIVIGNIESETGKNPHNAFQLRAMKDDLFTVNRSAADNTFMKPYYAITTGDTRIKDYYTVLSDHSNEVSAALVYDKNTNQYSSFLTLFLQNLFINSKRTDITTENRLTFLGLIPANPGIGTSVHRTFFTQGDIKLRIYYTKPTSVANR